MRRLIIYGVLTFIVLRIYAALSRIQTTVDRIDSNVSPDTLKAELVQLKIDIEENLKEYLSRDARSNKALDAADIQHSADMAALDTAKTQHTLDTLSLIDGSINRKIIDAGSTPHDAIDEAA